MRWLTGGPALVMVLLAVLAAMSDRVTAAPAQIQISALAIDPPPRYVIETDPTHATLPIRVNARITRNQLCPNGNLLLPCPAQPTPIRITVSLVVNPLGVGPILRPRVSTAKVVNYDVTGNANFEFSETVELDPTEFLGDGLENQITVRVEHIDDLVTGTYVQDGSRTFGPYRIAHFGGELRFGSIATTLTALSADPVWVSKSRWQLNIANAVAGNGRSVANTLSVPPNVLVERSDRGGLTVVTGAVEVLGSKTFAWSDWEGTRGLTRLSVDGYEAESITLPLPPGTGWRPANERLLRSSYQTSGARIPLDANLQPSRSVSGTVALDHEFVTETYPVVFGSRTWRWSGNALSLLNPRTRFVRQTAYQTIVNATGELPESNDGFWYLIGPFAASDLTILPGRTGGFGVEVTLQNGAFSPHFPMAQVEAPGAGSLVIERNRVVPKASGWTTASLWVPYGKGCRDAGDVGGLPMPRGGLALRDIPLRFTAAAGLWAEGASVLDLPESERHLEIGHNGGLPTHRTDDFPEWSFYAPGTWVPADDGIDRTDDTNGAVDEVGEDPLSFNPARYLLAGLQPGVVDHLEHPETTAYSNGAGDYAGANFRQAPGIRARSRIGGVVTDPYLLTTRSKYYARRSGVSGIHESASGPAQLPAYGYSMTLTNFGLSFLSNEAHDSRIEGSITLPNPSGFTQAFERLMVSCCGNLMDGVIDPADTQKQLAYWSGTRMTMQSLRFTHDPNDPCDTKDALLELGITADVGHLDEQPGGFLYPRPNGSLVAMDDLGRESHLALSAMVNLAGYPFMAVRRGYFNEHSEYAGGPGWINLAGLAGVSFFRDLEVHAHVLGSSANPQPPLYVKEGWTANSDNYFNHAGFDVEHRGYPPLLTVPNYQSGTTHLTHARQNWLGTVNFDYAVAYDGLTRSFRSPEPNGLDLGVLETESKVERLDAELADLRFSAHLNLSLLGSVEFLVEEGVSALTGVVEKAAVDAIALGMDRLGGLLDTQLRRVLDEVVLPELESHVVNPLVNALPASGDPIVIQAQLDLHFTQPFANALQSLADFSSSATNLTEQVSDALGRAENALATVRGVLLTLTQAEQLILDGLERLGITPDQLPEPVRSEVMEALEESLNELELPGGGEAGEVLGRLVEIRNAIQELEGAISNIEEALGQGQAFFEQLQETVLEPIGDYAQMGLVINERLGNWLKAGFALEPLGYDKNDLRRRIREEIRDAFLQSPITSRLQALYRSWLYNADSAVRNALDTALQAVNDQIVEVAMVAFEEIQTAVQAVKTFSSVVESVNWDGRAHIRDDRLAFLRLDNRVIVNVPTPVPGIQVPVEFTGYYQFRELTSDGPIGCIEGNPARMSEILLGATAGPASIFGSGNKLTVETKFTRDSDGMLLGLAGGLTMEHQSSSIEIASLDELSATLSISPGLGEGYISAFAQGSWVLPTGGGVASPMKMSGGVFVGRTCSFDTFAWDPLAPEVLGGSLSATNAFTGFYIMGEAVIPFASAACVLNASAGAGVRLYYSDPEWDFAGVTMGARLDGSVSGEFLCLVKLKGSAFLQGGLTGPNSLFFFDGGAELEGKLGVCPLCVTFDPSIRATYVEGGGWDISY